jgi:hypothetical protein
MVISARNRVCGEKIYFAYPGSGVPVFRAFPGLSRFVRAARARTSSRKSPWRGLGDHGVMAANLEHAFNPGMAADPRRA